MSSVIDKLEFTRGILKINQTDVHWCTEILNNKIYYKIAKFHSTNLGFGLRSGTWWLAFGLFGVFTYFIIKSKCLN